MHFINKLCPALITALLFSSYTVTATGSSWTLLMLLDTLSFAALIYFTLHFISKIKSLKLRIGIAAFASIVTSVLFIGNVFHYQVFHEWIHSELIDQWRIGLSTQSDIFNTLTFNEIFFALLIPLALSIFTVIGTYKPIQYSKRAVLLALILSLSIHSAASSTHFEPSENNFLVNLVRESVVKSLSPESRKLREQSTITSFFELIL